MTLESKTPIMAATGLAKSFQAHRVLSKIDFAIHPGEVVSLIGPSGSGKTTLLRCLAMLETPTAGEIRVEGQIVALAKPNRAAQVLGLSPRHTFVRIVLPQAVRLTLPAIASNFVQLIKYSSLGSVISVSEITRRGMELSATAFRPLEIFTFIALVYFVICWPLAMTIRIWEGRLAAQ